MENVVEWEDGKDTLVVYECKLQRVNPQTTIFPEISVAALLRLAGGSTYLTFDGVSLLCPQRCRKFTIYQ